MVANSIFIVKDKEEQANNSMVAGVAPSYGLVWL